jgi:hypothetical protein
MEIDMPFAAPGFDADKLSGRKGLPVAWEVSKRYNRFVEEWDWLIFWWDWF